MFMVDVLKHQVPTFHWGCSAQFKLWLQQNTCRYHLEIGTILPKEPLSTECVRELPWTGTGRYDVELNSFLFPHGQNTVGTHSETTRLFVELCSVDVSRSKQTSDQCRHWLHQREVFVHVKTCLLAEATCWARMTWIHCSSLILSNYTQFRKITAVSY